MIVALHSSFGVKHARHEAVKHTFATLTSGLKEPAETHFQNAQGGDIRGDILTEDKLGTQQATVLDVSIVEDRGISGQDPLNCWSDRHCATRIRERAKIAKYRSVCEQHGYLFRPMVYSSLGSLGFTSRKGLRLLAGAVCPSRGDSSCQCRPKHGTVESCLRFRHWIVRLASAFWRGTGRLVKSVKATNIMMSCTPHRPLVNQFQSWTTTIHNLPVILCVVIYSKTQIAHTSCSTALHCTGSPRLQHMRARTVPASRFYHLEALTTPKTEMPSVPPIWATPAQPHVPSKHERASDP